MADRNAAVAGFAERAIVERRPDALSRAALSFVAIALQAEFAELCRVASDGRSLEVTHRLSGDDPDIRLGIDSEVLHAEALRRRVVVVRKLDERDYRSAPHLRTARYGAAIAVESGRFSFVLAVFSHDAALQTRSMYPLQAISVIYAATITRCMAELAESALHESREDLRRLSGTMHRVQEEERRRIAREVHDELGQRLTALRLELGLLRTELRGSSDAAEERIAGMLGLVDETIATVRRVATDIRPALLEDFGLRAALEHELAEFVRRTGIDAAFSFTPDDLSIGPARATSLYRMLQEALTNVARHSGAMHVDVRVTSRSGRIDAEVRDDGRGIRDDEVGSLFALGLSGLRERVASLGGEVSITGRPGAGTCVHISIPDEKDPDRG